jgi:hypothetical protein
MSLFEEPLAACYEDFGPLYKRLAAATDIEPFELLGGDEVLTRGTLAYFHKDQFPARSKRFELESDFNTFRLHALGRRLYCCQADILKGPYCNAVIFIIDISTKTVAKRSHPVLLGSPAPGPGKGPQRLGRLPGHPGPQCDLWVPDRRLRPRFVVDGGRSRN